MFRNVVLTMGMAAIIAGCGTSATKLTEISPGMTKNQVKRILGKPESVSARGAEELFTYTLSNSWNSNLWNEKYHVYFINGRVSSYGN